MINQTSNMKNWVFNNKLDTSDSKNYWDNNTHNNIDHKSKLRLGNSYHEYLFWIGFAFLLIVGYKYFSDGSFSAILTLSSAFQSFAFVLLAFKINYQLTFSGISINSLILYSISLTSRLSSTLFFNGYLPVDKSGDWVYQLSDLFSLSILLLIIFWRYSRLKHQYKHENDQFYTIIPIAICAILAVIIHPDLNSYFIADFAWTYSLYIETVAILPQLLLMTKVGGEVENLTSHYIASVACSKFLSFIFWLFSFKELAYENGNNLPGFTVIFAYTIQLILFADFIYAYIKSLKLGKALIIPTNVV